MRYIHPVTIRETFTASGVYLWTAQTETAPPQESWSIHQLPDGSDVIRVDIGGWDTPGQNALVEILCNVPDTVRNIDRFDVHWFEGRRPALVGHYVFFADYVQARTIVGSDSEVEEVPLSRHAVIAPPGLLNLRYIISMARQEWDGLPELFPPLDDNIEGIILEKLGDRQIEIDGEPHAAQGYRIAYRMKRGRIDTRVVWFDRYEIPLLIEEGKLQARLTRYSRRPEQKQ